ncbi:Erv41p NDAI_0D03080 [Naumovozyma dairenensis CBS 421]|uniref:Endoplasmic reticulum-Golgi intermediate compartment protein n=1 Tax=Naumovozyma dairenensis (strain ATCC 10597 / BCRC 20456 / CBS 421 / NBRC 0211 / NRRL Y-12639) TaxID=1071378 RepID=G0WA11_NAUDC|nr:hypothetical protein NDAI_0D03080 [Naumovozyma dairenensis CBS 421]CCD24622.1 hypothetical protein NDAI_0D03080 [Naumovozyma dairenensis CBS 421]
MAASLKVFDAFPKIEDQNKKKSTKGGITSILTYVLIIFIAWSEFGSYFGGFVDQQYIVDGMLRETVPINLDLYVNVPCEWVHVNVRDQTLDRKFASQELKFEEMPFFIPFDVRLNDNPEIVTPELDEILGEAIPAEFREKLDTRMFFDENNPDKSHLPDFNGCHIFGSVNVNQVAGELQVTAKGHGYADYHRAPLEKVNFAHVINEFSFGEFFPYIDNPLDNSAKFNMDDPLTAYVYDTSVIPMIYRKMGAEVDTFQYSVAEHQYKSKESSSSNSFRVPGIFFQYNFENLSIVVSDRRLGFIQFIVRLVAILSFAVYIASWLFILADMFIVIIMGPKWSLRYQPSEQSHGLLE